MEKSSTSARKYACIIIFPKAPSIQELLPKVFDGTSEVDSQLKFNRACDRPIDYNTLWNTVYDLGYEPNCSVVACDDFRMFAKLIRIKNLFIEHI